MANNGARPNSESSSFPCKRLPRYSEASSWGTGKNLGVHAATACSSDESVADHPVYLPSSPLISAQRAWSNICAPLLVQRICCFFSIRQSTSWSTVDSTCQTQSYLRIGQRYLRMTQNPL